MSRPLRLQAPGLVYHVMSRGNARMVIFLDDGDRRRFLQHLATMVDRYGVMCHAYCLMPNHYHLLLKTTQGNLSQAIRQLNGAYCQWWNREHQRVGHVLQGRFKAQVVQERNYLLAVSRYIAVNPVRAGLVQRPEDWPWASYPAVVGASPPPPFLDITPVAAEFGVGRNGRRAFARFVSGSAGSLNVQEAIRGDHRVIGDQSFIEQFRAEAAAASREVPRRDSQISKPGLRAILGDDLRPSVLHPRVRRARVEYGYSCAEIAQHMNLHPAAVRRILRSEHVGDDSCSAPNSSPSREPSLFRPDPVTFQT